MLATHLKMCRAGRQAASLRLSLAAELTEATFLHPGQLRMIRSFHKPRKGSREMVACTNKEGRGDSSFLFFLSQMMKGNCRLRHVKHAGCDISTNVPILILLILYYILHQKHNMTSETQTLQT